MDAEAADRRSNDMMDREPLIPMAYPTNLDVLAQQDPLASLLVLQGSDPYTVYLKLDGGEIVSFSLGGEAEYTGGIAWSYDKTGDALMITFVFVADQEGDIQKLISTGPGMLHPLFSAPFSDAGTTRQVCCVPPADGTYTFNVERYNGGKLDPQIVVTPQ
jgi:hypothetical protein